MAPSPYPHYIWAFGHFVVLLTTFWYLKAYVTFQSGNYAWWYKASFLGSIISYAIVCYKSLGVPQPNIAYVHRALADENVQYFLMAILWWSSKPLPLALVPYFVFSLFHGLSFARTNIIPKVLPPTPAPTGPNGTATNGPPVPALSRTIQVWVKANYDAAMVVVARVELLIFVRAVLGVLFLKNSLLVPILYGHFLRSRYYYSAFTRDAVHTATALIEGFVDRPGNPPTVKKVYDFVKAFVVKWGRSRVIEPQAAAAAAAPRR